MVEEHLIGRSRVAATITSRVAATQISQGRKPLDFRPPIRPSRVAATQVRALCRRYAAGNVFGRKVQGLPPLAIPMPPLRGYPPPLRGYSSPLRGYATSPPSRRSILFATRLSGPLRGDRINP